MSSDDQKNKKYREYSQKSILSKVNPQFVGIAKSYSSVKKQRLISQQLKNEYLHEVSAMNKINQSLQKKLKNKKKQYRYVQEVRDRYISQIMEKQRRQQSREVQQERARQKTIQDKMMNNMRLKQAKQRMQLKKKLEYSETKDQLDHLKSYKRLQQSRIIERNQSRVKQIQDDKRRINDYCNRFYQNRNKRFLQSYKQLIKKQKLVNAKSKQQTITLQQKLLLLKEKAADKKAVLDQLNNSIDSIRETNLSRKSSRAFSTRSMTPFEILSSDTKQKKQKIKQSKIMLRKL